MQSSNIDDTAGATLATDQDVNGRGRATAGDSALMTGAEYMASLRDGRRVLAADGEWIEDVTAHPALAPGIETLAGLYDAQFDPATQDVMTYQDTATGLRMSTAWKVPTTLGDLRARRELLRFTTYKTLGRFGRALDYGATVAMGYLSSIGAINKAEPELSGNLERFVEAGRTSNEIMSVLFADVQSDRSIPVAQKPGRLRCVEERPDALVLYGAKAAATISAQGHTATIMTVQSPDADPDTVILGVVPVNSPGLTMVLREPVARQTDFESHPFDAGGEESDAMMLFDNVVVPRENIFCFRNTEVLKLVQEIIAFPVWHVLARVAYRAEIVAATAQLVVDVLGTDSIPQVRDSVADITAYATNLRSYVIASEAEAVEREGVLVPNPAIVSAGRLHALVEYPNMIQRLRDISGQGVVSRFTKAQFEDPAIGARLEEFLPGTGATAREKNRLFNFVWDLALSDHAGRLGQFEHLNGYPPSHLRASIYRSPERRVWANEIADYLAAG